MSLNPNLVLNAQPGVQLIEPPHRAFQPRPQTAQERKRKEARLFLKSVADRLKTNQQERSKTQKATWQPAQLPAQNLHIFEDSARVIEEERLKKELSNLKQELRFLKQRRTALEAEVKDLTVQADALPRSQTSPEELVALRESLEEQRERLARELEALQSTEQGDISLPGPVAPCPMCTQNLGKIVPPIDQKLAELRLQLKQMQTQLEEKETRLAGRKAAAIHYQQLLTGAPNVTREEQKLKTIQDRIAEVTARLQARRNLTSIAQSSNSPQAVAAALNDVREIEQQPETRSHSVTILQAKDAWASAPSAVRTKLKELHSRRTALQQELEAVEKDLRTPIEEDAYLHAAVRKAMLSKKVNFM